MFCFLKLWIPFEILEKTYFYYVIYKWLKEKPITVLIYMKISDTETWFK